MMLHPSGVSNRDLLEIGTPVSRIKNKARISAANQASPTTLKLLALRVEFQEDSNNLTTGNGKFDLSTSSSAVIDAPPHDLNYFQNQLLALANYFQTVSNGQLLLEAEVFPKESSRSYTVSQEMAYYSPVQPEELVDQRLAELFQESLQIADDADDIDFSQYDSFILFHAGVGLDFAIDLDQTPQDVPSVFLDYLTLQKILGNNDPTYPGISVNEGSFFVKDGMILPETQSQEGFQIALLGTMAIMFGHQLGLPNLFSTDTGLPGVGIFGLMDQGSGNFSGLLPAEPCAWSKLFLRWENAIEVKNGTDLQIAARHARNSNKIYKIPIDSREYFLLENRHRDVNADGIAIGRDANGKRIEFKWNEEGQQLIFDGSVGVITQVNEYDFGLPGSGILIWHVDERIIEANFTENRVNADPEHRGVDLEEADGAQDIGQVYGFLSPGSGAENGVIEDMFWGSNPINMLVNDSSSVVAFTPFTRPNSLSNAEANSHIFITDFSEPDSVMTFSVHESISLSGFPQFTGAADRVVSSPMLADLDGDEQMEIILNSESSTNLFVWKFDGTKLIANQDAGQIEKVNGDLTSYPLAIFATPKGTTSFTPAVVQRNAERLVVAVTDEVVAAYLPQDLDFDGRADSLFVFASSAKLTTPPLVVESGGDFDIVVGNVNGEIIIVNSDGFGTVLADPDALEITGLALYSQNRMAFTSKNGETGLLGIDGTVHWQNALGAVFSNAPVVGDLDKDGALNIVAVSEDGQIFAFDPQGQTLDDYPKSTGLNPSSQVVLGDVDGDKFLEMVFVAEKKLYAFNHTGSLTSQFPILLSDDISPKQIFSSPILVDFDQDGRSEIVVGTLENRLVAFHANGQLVNDFPLSTGGAINSTPALADVDADGDIEIAAAADDGFLYVWDLVEELLPENVAWGSLFHDIQHTNANLNSESPAQPSGQLMPAKFVYNYPNPTEGTQTTIRYRLNFPAQIQIKIYDLAGELIDEFSGPGHAQADNEVEWPLSGVESGVYLARVEAKGNGLTDVAFVKIAVVK